MLVRVALGRQIKERQGWVDRAEPRRFLVSFDVESDSYAAAAGECLTSGAAVPEIEPRLGTLEEVGATDEAGYLVVGADDFEDLRHRRTETHASRDERRPLASQHEYRTGQWAQGHAGCESGHAAVPIR